MKESLFSVCATANHAQLVQIKTTLLENVNHWDFNQLCNVDQTTDDPNYCYDAILETMVELFQNFYATNLETKHFILTGILDELTEQSCEGKKFYAILEPLSTDDLLLLFYILVEQIPKKTLH